MDNLHVHYKKIAAITSVMMLIVIGLWVINPRPIYAGFVLGTIASLLNIFLIYRYVIKVTEIALTGSRKRMPIGGMFWRTLSVIGVVFIAQKTNGVDVFATVFGAFSAQIVAYIYLFIYSYLTRHTKGGKI